MEKADIWYPFCNMISVAIINNGFYKITIMKKVLVAVALVMGLGSSVAFAQEVINTTSVEMQAQVPQDEFTKIDVKELPEAVAQAVAKNYEGATIKEAYVAEKESGKVYKVILTTKDSQEVTVLMNEKGEEVKE